VKVSLKAAAYVFGIVGFLAACQGTTNESSTKARELTKEEKTLDMEVAFNNFRQYYAPLHYKAKILKTDYEAVFAQLREEAAQTKSDQEFYDVMGKLVDSFKDGHVGVRYPGLDTFSLPFSLDYFDGHYVVENIDPEFSKISGVKVGDDLVAIDGVSAREIASQLLQFGSIGYDKADERVAAARMTNRRFMTPKSSQVYLDFRRASDGSVFNVPTLWSRNPGIIAKSSGTKLMNGLVSDLAESSVRLFGKRNPFFSTPKVEESFGFVKVGVTAEQWAAAGQSGAPFDVFAALYRHQGKTILLIRIPSYSLPSPTIEEVNRNVKTYEILLKQYSNLADVLVLDQTHNPGGSVDYVEQLSRLFFKRPGPGFGFKPRADRLWLEGVNLAVIESGENQQLRQYFKGIYSLLDAANTAGEFLGPQMSLTGATTTLVENTAWSKPILLLIDELCGSGGDAFPMLMKGNKVATLFGHRTSGLGGNVEELPPLPNSRAVFRMTRSFFYLASPDGKLEETAIIENNGVSPDMERTYGYEDFKDQFSTYVRDFSNAAVGLVKE
jgi:C-terminal processing protease CtpA/Prc